LILPYQSIIRSRFCEPDFDRSNFEKTKMREMIMGPPKGLRIFVRRRQGAIPFPGRGLFCVIKALRDHPY
jgi:hypothetical protein